MGKKQKHNPVNCIWLEVKKRFKKQIKKKKRQKTSNGQAVEDHYTGESRSKKKIEGTFPCTKVSNIDADVKTVDALKSKKENM